MRLSSALDQPGIAARRHHRYELPRSMSTRRHHILVVLGVLMLHLGLASQTDAAGTGAISGTVTSASTHTPIAGINVCAVSTVLEVTGEEGEEAPQDRGCATTDASGAYTISGLSASEYYVEFRATSQTPSYVSQFYNDKQTAPEAEPVSVHAASTTPAIDAELRTGGQITGTVTSAATHAPVALIFACALGLGARAVEQYPCALTSSSGTYRITNLPAGSYDVEFIDLRAKYSPQYYNLKPSSAEATAVLVSPPALTTGIDAVLQHGEPGKAGTPNGVSGTTPPGGGAPKAPLAFPLQLSSSGLLTRGRTALVRLICHAAATCHGTLALTTRRRIARHGKRGKRTVPIGTASFTVPAEHTATIKLRLNAAGRNLIKAAHGRLSCQLTIDERTPGPPRIAHVNVRLAAR